MNTNIKRAIVGTLSAAMVLTGVCIEHAQAASNKTPAVAPAQNYTGPTDVSSRRRTYRGSNPAAAIAMFGAIAGTAIALSQARRHHRYYGGVPYGYGGHYGAPYAYQPYGYGYYGPPRYRYW